jgi:formamidopyrimidine-DNA glycosylase
MARRLQPFVGYQIQDILVDVSAATNEKRYLPEPEYNALKNAIVTGIFRRGKFLVFTTRDGAILCHNAMSGYWDTGDNPWTFDYVEGARTAKDSDVRVSFLIEKNGAQKALRFHDARKFGSVHFVDKDRLAEKLTKLGPEAVWTEHSYEPNNVISSDFFVETFKEVKLPIKVALMEQSLVAGVGNIYAAETLWAASIDPRRPAQELSETDLRVVHEAMGMVLTRSMDVNYDKLKIYRRKQCPVCSEPTISEELKGRNTWWCAKCQK